MRFSAPAHRPERPRSRTPTVPCDDQVAGLGISPRQTGRPEADHKSKEVMISKERRRAMQKQATITSKGQITVPREVRRAMVRNAWTNP